MTSPVVWPGRRQGDEAEWRSAIREFDRAFHRWMNGKGTDDEMYQAYETFNAILADDYLENEAQAAPVFPQYGTTNIRGEEQLCSFRGQLAQDAIEAIRKGSHFAADDDRVFRRHMYFRAQRLNGRGATDPYYKPVFPEIQWTLE